MGELAAAFCSLADSYAKLAWACELGDKAAQFYLHHLDCHDPPADIKFCGKASQIYTSSRVTRKVRECPYSPQANVMT